MDNQNNLKNDNELNYGENSQNYGINSYNRSNVNYNVALSNPNLNINNSMDINIKESVDNNINNNKLNNINTNINNTNNINSNSSNEVIDDKKNSILHDNLYEKTKDNVDVQVDVPIYQKQDLNKSNPVSEIQIDKNKYIKKTSNNKESVYDKGELKFVFLITLLIFIIIMFFPNIRNFFSDLFNN